MLKQETKLRDGFVHYTVQWEEDGQKFRLKMKWDMGELVRSRVGLKMRVEMALEEFRKSALHQLGRDKGGAGPSASSFQTLPSLL